MSSALDIKLNLPVKSDQGCLNLIKAFQAKISAVVPKHIQEAVILNAVMNSVRKNPKLLNCTTGSMLSAIMCCAETGLVPDNPLQLCHLVPFKGQVVWIPGFRGLVELARRSGEIGDVDSDIACENDEFYYERGLNQNIIHKPNLHDRGDMTHVYAIMWFLDNRIRAKFEVMTVSEVNAIRDASPGRDNDPWRKHYGQQARKTVLKRLMKAAPLSPQLALAINQDNLAEAGEELDLHEAVQELRDDVASMRIPATDKLAEDLKKTAVESGALPEETTEDDTSEAIEVAIKEIQESVEANKVVLSEKLLKRCANDNLLQMGMEALGVVKAEIEEQVEEASRRQASAAKS